VTSLLKEYGNISYYSGDMEKALEYYSDAYDLAYTFSPTSSKTLCYQYKRGKARYFLRDFVGARLYPKFTPCQLQLMFI
jgi:hypothetical protein